MAFLRQDATLTSGFWLVRPEEGPGPISVTLQADRTILVLGGAVEYAVADGPTYHLRQGDAASFPQGTEVTLRVLEPLRQFYVDVT